MIDSALNLLNNTDNATSIIKEELLYKITIENYSISNTQLKMVDVYDNEERIIHLFKIQTNTHPQTLHEKVFN